MNPTKLSKSVLTQIKEEKITPRARWEFVVKTFLFLVGGIIFLVLGILATAIIWNFLHDLYLLELFSIEKRTFFKVLFAGLPIFWLVISAALVVLASYFVQHTKRGYKIPMHIWVIFAIVLQILGGYILEQSPIGERLEAGMNHQLMVGESIREMRKRVWTHPEEGRLSGTISSKDEDVLHVTDLSGKEWTVDISQAKYPKDRISLDEEEKVRFIGKQENDSAFNAIKIFPWERRPGMEDRMRDRRPPNESDFRRERDPRMPPLLKERREDFLSL